MNAEQNDREFYRTLSANGNVSFEWKGLYLYEIYAPDLLTLSVALKRLQDRASIANIEPIFVQGLEAVEVTLPRIII